MQIYKFVSARRYCADCSFLGSEAVQADIKIPHETGFQLLTAVNIESTVFWDVILHKYGNLSYRGTRGRILECCVLNIQCRKNIKSEFIILLHLYTFYIFMYP
jgi:hypothetical protein